MNLQEYEKKLREISTNQFQKFNENFGGGQTVIEGVLLIL